MSGTASITSSLLQKHTAEGRVCVSNGVSLLSCLDVLQRAHVCFLCVESFLDLCGSSLPKG